MSKILGEAVQDQNTKKWFFAIGTDDKETLFKSDAVFQTQLEAETELIEMIQSFGEYVKNFGQGG